MTEPWEPLLNVTEESLVELIASQEAGSPLHRVTQRIVNSLGTGPDGVISAFQSVIEGDDTVSFSSAVA